MDDKRSGECWNGNDVNGVVMDITRCVPRAWTQEGKWDQGMIPHGLQGG